MNAKKNIQHTPTRKDREFHILKPNALEDHLDWVMQHGSLTQNDRTLITRNIDERRVIDNIGDAWAKKIRE